MNAIDNIALDIEILDGAVTPLLPMHRDGPRLLPYHVLVNHRNVSGRVRQAGLDYIVGDRGSYLIRRTVPHELTWLEGVNPVSVWCHFHVTLFHSIDFLSFYEIPPEFVPPLSEELQAKCEELVQPCSDSPLAEALRKKTLAFELVSLIISGCVERNDARERLAALDKLAPALDYIRRHTGEGFVLAEAANHVHLSVSRFSAVFKAVLGMPPCSYRQNLRLHRAYEELYKGNATPKEVAMLFGFCDEFHFAKAFRRKFGVTPASFRRKIITRGRWY